MKKRDAIEAMARAMSVHYRFMRLEEDNWRTLLPMATDAYNALCALAADHAKPRCSVTGEPLTVREQFEQECG